MDAFTDPALEGLVAQAPQRLQEPLARWLAAKPGRVREFAGVYSPERLVQLWSEKGRPDSYAKALRLTPVEHQGWVLGGALEARCVPLGEHILDMIEWFGFPLGLLRSVDRAYDGDTYWDLELAESFYTREPEMAALVRAALASPRPVERWLAVQHYDRFPMLGVADLVPALHDEDENVRRWAAWQFANVSQRRPGVTDIVWEAARAHWEGFWRCRGPGAVGLALDGLVEGLPPLGPELLPRRVDPVSALEGWYSANDYPVPERVEVVDTPAEAAAGAFRTIREGVKRDLAGPARANWGGRSGPWRLNRGFGQNPMQPLYPLRLQPGYLRAAANPGRRPRSPFAPDMWPECQYYPEDELFDQIVEESGEGSRDRPWVERWLPLLPYLQNPAHYQQLLSLERLSRSTNGWIALADCGWVCRPLTEG